MEVTGKSRAKVIIDSCLHESSVYFSDHVRILKCNPYCTNVSYLEDPGIYQWIFQVKDPRDNPITAVFYVEQHEGHLPLDGIAPQDKPDHPQQEGITAAPRCIRWVNRAPVPEVEWPGKNTFIGQANSRICLYHLDANRTEVHFETEIILDFELSFPLNLMPEGILKFMSEAIMSGIMQQATESMLCQVQSDICCSVPELSIEGLRS